MHKQKSVPIALTIAGSDSGGGAGIQADLKAFAALGVHGVCAVTCFTAQNPKRVRGIQPCTPQFLRLQLDAVFDGLRPAAAKTGMLCSATLIRAVAAFLLSHPRLPLVVDPVMVSTSGAALLDPKAVDVLCSELLPLAALVTPNLPEAEVLTGKRLRSVEDLRAAAKELHRRFGCAVLVKGGHLRGYREAVDIYHDGRQELLLRARSIKAGKTHGTGCTYSAAITAHLAQGRPLSQAVSLAKEYITQAIAHSRLAGRYHVLGGIG